MIGRMLLGLALSIGASQGAAAQERLSINIIGVGLEAPIPEGYCVPTGAGRAVADLIAAADHENVTHATLFRCDRIGNPDGPGNDYYLIKTPRQALVLSVSRPELIAELEQEFGKAEWQAGGEQVTKIADEVSGSLSDTFHTPVVVDGSFAPRGTDADCAYLGGQATISMEKLSYPIQAGACMTSVGGKLITVYAYDDPKGADGIVRLMRKTRDLAMAFETVPQD